MAINLTRLAFEKSGQIIQKPQLVLEIDGVPTVYGIGTIKKYIRIGDPDLFIGNDWVIGGFNEVDDQLDLISLDGTTSTIQQQLLQDKGGTSSASSIQISLIDKNNQITELITPGVIVDDILGRKATVYLGYQDTAWPQDFIVLFSGIIDEITAESRVILNITHPEAKKRSTIFPKTTTELTAALKFRSATIQSIVYQTKRDVVGTVTITYTGTASAGSETVLVSGTSITVDIQNGVSTAGQVRNAIEKTPEAVALVMTEILDGQAATAQTTVGATSLTSDTTVSVTSTEGFLDAADSGNLRTYVRIDDEIIEYTGKTATTFTGCTREAFATSNKKTRGTHHNNGTEVSSFYRLQGNALELALKILMSGGDTYFAENVEIGTIGEVEDVGVVANSVYFPGVNIQDKYGLVSQDMVTITGDPNAANNVTDREISSVVVTQFGSYLILDGASLVTSLNTPAVIKFRSKYNVLGEGLGMGGDQIDVPRFEEINTSFNSSIFDYDFYIDEDAIQAKDFIDSKILFPTGAFSLPRKGKISVGYSSPPLAVSNVPVFNSSNTARPDQNKLTRSSNKNFYNNLLFRYNRDILDNEKFLSGDLTADADSKNRIPNVGNKVFLIDAPGLRPSGDTDIIINILINRILDRYKFGAEKISIQSFYGDTFNIDIGDVVLYGDESLKLPDTKFGDREFRPRLFEIVNKFLDIKTGSSKLELIDTLYSTEGARFGIFSPSTIVGSGSSTTQIAITDSYSTVAPAKEKEKWQDFVGEQILIHNEDFSYAEERTFTGFLPGNDYIMLVDPALPSPPAAGCIIEVDPYPTGTEPSENLIYKNIFVFSDPQVQITAGTSSTVFSVGAGDVGKLFEGAFVIIHNDDWSSYSPETRILDITGTTITVEDDLGFTPTSSFYIDLIGFPDEGAPYRYL